MTRRDERGTIRRMETTLTAASIRLRAVMLRDAANCLCHRADVAIDERPIDESDLSGLNDEQQARFRQVLFAMATIRRQRRRTAKACQHLRRALDALSAVTSEA